MEELKRQAIEYNLNIYIAEAARVSQTLLSRIRRRDVLSFTNFAKWIESNLYIMGCRSSTLHQEDYQSIYDRVTWNHNNTDNIYVLFYLQVNQLFIFPFQLMALLE